LDFSNAVEDKYKKKEEEKGKNKHDKTEKQSLVHSQKWRDIVD